MKEEEVVQEGMDSEGQLMEVALDGLHYPVESPRGCGKAEGKVLEDVDLAVDDKCQEHLEEPVDWDMIICVLEVQCASPKRVHYAGGDEGDRLHVEGWDEKELVEEGKVYDKTKRPALLPD